LWHYLNHKWRGFSITYYKKDILAITNMNFTDTTKKIILPAVLLIISLSSCRKDAITVTEDKSTAINNGSSIVINEDDLLHKVTVTIPTQEVKTSVKNNVLTMVYTEDLSALLDPKGYDLSYSIRLNEDFTSSALNKLDYTVPAPNGSYTSGWHGNDLKVLEEVTKTETVVNNKPMVRLRLLRYFTFTQKFSTEQQAIDRQNILLNTKTDVVKFTSYVVFGKEYPATTGSAALVYVK
jgi:hypothetical protein